MNQPGCSNTTEPFALRVIGEDMAPEFQDGHIIIVDPSHPLCNDAYVVLEYQGEILFGLYNDRGQQTLSQLNSPAQPIVLEQPFSLKGVVIQRSSGRRRNIKHYEY